MKRLIVNKNFLEKHKISKELFNFENIRTYYEDYPAKGMVKILFKDYLPDDLTQISVEAVVLGIEDIQNFSELQETIATPIITKSIGVNINRLKKLGIIND